MKRFQYHLYLDADLNRVFTGALLEVAATELRVVLDRLLPNAVDEIERAPFGRARVLRFDSDTPTTTLAPIVGQLSSATALFVNDVGGEPLLRPVPIVEHLVYGSELATIQRYRGKTNERLTRAMVNMALAGAAIDPAQPAGTVLDPMCGRGTTLNWALAYGLNAVGMDVDATALGHHATFLETWAKRSRLPHKAERFRKNNAEHRVASIRVGPDRAALKAGGQLVQTFLADAGADDVALAKGSIDVIVTDLPYGIQHRGSAGEEDSTVALLERVLPAWHRHLRPGGALCLAWNTRRATRREVTAALAAAGFAPVTVSGGYSMRHTVDATIERDVVLATKPVVNR